MEKQTFNINLKLASFNCKYFKIKGPKCDFMSQIMCENDILLVQEHWLLESHLSKLKQLDACVDVVGKSSMDEHVPLIGRPFGGCAIVYKTTHTGFIKEVKCCKQRLRGVLLAIYSGCSILILNAYMPVDNYRHDENFTIYVEVISEVEQIIPSLDPTHVIFGGDFNNDLIRSSPHALALSQFIDDFNMTICIDLDTECVLIYNSSRHDT